MKLTGLVETNSSGLCLMEGLNLLLTINEWSIQNASEVRSIGPLFELSLRLTRCLMEGLLRSSSNNERLLEALNLFPTTNNFSKIPQKFSKNPQECPQNSSYPFPSMSAAGLLGPNLVFWRSSKESENGPNKHGSICN